jgi:DNA-binding phage protein
MEYQVIKTELSTEALNMVSAGTIALCTAKSEIILSCIAFAIKQRNLSAREVARKADIHPNIVTSIINGNGNPTLDSITKICRALNLKITIK